jgi:hypothetical protein
MTTHLAYNLTKGLPWQRLIIVRDNWTHRVQKPIDAWGVVKTSNINKMPFTVNLTSEGGILLTLSEEQTKDLPAGNLQFDVIATLPKRAMFNGDSTTVTRPVAEGTITVSEMNNITPIEEIDYMEIRIAQGEDFYRSFTWRDDSGTLVTVQNAYMQAIDSTNNMVLDLRWFSTAPNEATISGLPAIRRGYITSVTNESLIIHISDTNPISAGEYPFDIFVQDNAGDWSRLTKGTLVVEASVSVKP